MEISGFDFQIHHIKVSDNVLANYLSRIKYHEKANEVYSIDTFPLSPKFICKETERK